MKLGFVLPQHTLQLCFSQNDLSRLDGVYEKVLPSRDHPLIAGAWADRTEDVDVCVTGWGTPPISDAMLSANPKLKLITHAAGSTRHLLPASFWSRNIRLATANEALGVGVAETTLSLMVAGLKGLFPASYETRAGRWRGDSKPGGFPIRELYGVTIGLIGASKIGRHVIRLLANFEVNVLLTDPFVSSDEAKLLGVELVSLDDLLRRSDVVSLHAPALPETRHMLSREQFKLIRNHAIFINTARGMIVDEAALCDELRTGRIFAFLDVTDPEPPAADHPFRSLPNVVLLPHIAGAVGNGCLRMGRSIVDQLLEFASGQALHGEITHEQWQRMA